MATLKCGPHGGINRIFPGNRMVSKNAQKLRVLENFTSLDGRIKKVGGAIRAHDNLIESGSGRWGRRIYLERNGERFRTQFACIGNKLYQLDEGNRLLNQCTIDGDIVTSLNDFGYPRDATMKVGSLVTTFLVDGEDFFKYNGNVAGNWEKLQTKLDTEGEEIHPVECAEYLDRTWVLQKNKNKLWYSANGNPELYSDSTDCGDIDLPPGDGGFPVALVKIRGFLYIWHEDYFTPLSGTSHATFGINPGDVIYGYGTRARRSVIRARNFVTFLNSKDNEWYVTGGTLDSTKIMSYELHFKELVNPNKVDETVATFHDDIFRASYIKTGQATLNSEVMYSFDEEKWCGQTEDRRVSVYCPWNGDGDQNELITLRSDIGVVMKNDVGFNFDDQAIRARLVTADYEVDELRDGVFEYVYIDAVPSGNYSLPIKYLLDARIGLEGVENINMRGDVVNLGLITIQNQLIFVTKAFPKIGKNRGRMIRFEIDDQTLGRDIQLFNLFAVYHLTNRKFSKTIVGV